MIFRAPIAFHSRLAAFRILQAGGTVQVNQLLFNRILDDFPAVMEIEFAHHISLVRVNGLHAQQQMGRDVLYGAAVGKQFKHFSFPIGKEFVAGGARL